jgi:hypothetical protein
MGESKPPWWAVPTQPSALMIKAGVDLIRRAESVTKELPTRMKRISRLVRAVLIPVAALTILVASAVPASAESYPGGVVSAVTKPVVRLLSMDW